MWPLLFAFGMLGADPPKPPARAPQGPAQAAPQGPIDFRCDGLQAFQKPSRVHCQGNVVVRRADLLLCCTSFEGYADTKGAWERFVCRTDVRAQRGDELMWADEATFILALDNLTLTGRPTLERGKSLLAGERIVVDTKDDQAHIEKPRGRVEPAEARNSQTSGATPSAAPATTPTANDNPPPLPEHCPLPERPKRSP